MVLEEGSPFKHLLTLNVTPDGGLVVFPAQRSDTWTFSRRDERAQVLEEAQWRGAARPKLHYHRSGFTSLELPGVSVGRRISVDLPPLASVAWRQVFTLHQVNPRSSPDMDDRGERLRAIKPLDSFVVCHAGMWPYGVGVTGVLIQHRAGPWLRKTYRPALEGDGFPAIQSVPGARYELIWDLAARGIPSFLALRFHFDPSPLVGAANTTLAGFCGLQGWPSPSVVACSGDGTPVIGLLSRDGLPVFPYQGSERSRDLRRVTRRVDAPPDYGEWV